jgi:hypothetical protein
MKRRPLITDTDRRNNTFVKQTVQEVIYLRKLSPFEINTSNVAAFFVDANDKSFNLSALNTFVNREQRKDDRTTSRNQYSSHLFVRRYTVFRQEFEYQSAKSATFRSLRNNQIKF